MFVKHKSLSWNTGYALNNFNPLLFKCVYLLSMSFCFLIRGRYFERSADNVKRKFVQSIDEMLKPKTQAPWGNHFAFLHVQVPIMEKVENPLEFVRTTKLMMDRHKMSLGVFINAKILRCLLKLKGPQVCLNFQNQTPILKWIK